MTANHLHALPSLSVADLLRRYRTERGMTQFQLSSAIGCSDAMVCRLESGSRNASRRVLPRLADALELSPPEHDALLLAGGYAPAAPLADEPVVAMLASVLRDPLTPEYLRGNLRRSVRAALNQARQEVRDAS